MQNLFMMVDTDRSGRLSEREFAEFWVYTQQSHIPGFGQWGQPMHTTTTVMY